MMLVLVAVAISQRRLLALLWCRYGINLKTQRVKSIQFIETSVPDSPGLLLPRFSSSILPFFRSSVLPFFHSSVLCSFFFSFSPPPGQLSSASTHPLHLTSLLLRIACRGAVFTLLFAGYWLHSFILSLFHRFIVRLFHCFRAPVMLIQSARMRQTSLCRNQNPRYRSLLHSVFSPSFFSFSNG